MEKTKYLIVGIDKYDEDIKIPYNDIMTLGQFKEIIEKAICSSIKLNITKYDQKKDKPMKEIIKENFNIFALNNENLGDLVKNWKGNFINENNSCYRDSYVQCLIHTLIPKIVEFEEEERKKKGLPIAKDFKELLHKDRNSEENKFYEELLGICDEIKKKMEEKDESPMSNAYDQSRWSPDEGYGTGGNYPSINIPNLSISSTRRSSGLAGGSLHLNVFLESFKLTHSKEDHTIIFKEKTIISDCLGIDVRNFQKCKNCNYSNISSINIGNITIPIYDYLKSGGDKSFNGLLKYYYKINYFGNNSKKGEKCEKCKKFVLEFYNKISTLPEILLIDFNLRDYYNNTAIDDLKKDSFYWFLEEQISLSEHYDRIDYDISSVNDCNYELSSFIGHYGSIELGYFINFSKIDNQWYMFDDLEEKPEEFGKFEQVKEYLKTSEHFSTKIKICNCFYKRNKCKGYENYIEEIKNNIKKCLDKNNAIENLSDHTLPLASRLHII